MWALDLPRAALRMLRHMREGAGVIARSSGTKLGRARGLAGIQVCRSSFLALVFKFEHGTQVVLPLEQGGRIRMWHGLVVPQQWFDFDA
jgi:hypothetical protein